MNLLRTVALLLLLALGPPPAAAEPVVREGFEGPEPSWRDAGGDANYKITGQERLPLGAHSGNGCERLRISGDNGSYVYLSHEVGEARIINELTASVWIKADRPGLQILVRAVLPRSLDPRTGRPLTTLMRGSGYTQAGNWQQLRIDSLPQLLQRQVRVLRAEHGPQIDEHEAYIDRVLVNVYGGPGTTTVSIDDLEVSGFVGRQATDPATAAAARTTTTGVDSERLPSTVAESSPGSTRPGSAGARLSGAGLVVGDKPFFPRLVEYRGEPLELLKSLGFNGVRLAGAPAKSLLDEAAASGMWIVGPPPPARDLQARAASGPAGRLGAEFDRVLVWDLGEQLSNRELEATKAWSRLIRSADARRRPLVCDADSDLLPYSRSVDVLWAHRYPLGSSLEFGQYAAWLHERPQLARPGTPTWTVIQTQPADRLVEQVGLLAAGSRLRPAWQDEQIRLLTFSALAAGVRGICFQSHAPLSGADPATRRRRALAERLNLELELIEPWCASGSFVTTAAGTDPDTAAAVMQTDRARLVLPLATAPSSQFALRLPSSGVASYVVPGVPESNDAYELVPGSLRPLAHKRVAGGIRVVMTEGEQGALVLLTQDSLVISNLTRRAVRAGKRAAELEHELASMHLARIDDVQPRLAASGHAPPTAASLLDAARATLRQAEAQLAKGDHSAALRQSRRAEQLLYQVERTSWEKTVQPVAAPLASALGVSYETLPEYWQFIDEMASAQRGANLLSGGEFEDLPAMHTSGWRHFQRPQAGVRTDVQLSAAQVHGGKLALRLEVVAEKPDQPPSLIETAPLWITSAGVPLDAGQVVCIHGWVKMPKPVAGSVDGLLIVDSFGGEPLAERINHAAGWREVTLYRAAPRSEVLTVTFALTGLGEVWLDDFSIQVVRRASGSAPDQARRPRAARAEPR